MHLQKWQEVLFYSLEVFTCDSVLCKIPLVLNIVDIIYAWVSSVFYWSYVESARKCQRKFRRKFLVFEAQNNWHTNRQESKYHCWVLTELHVQDTDFLCCRICYFMCLWPIQIKPSFIEKKSQFSMKFGVMNKLKVPVAEIKCGFKQCILWFCKAIVSVIL